VRDLAVAPAAPPTIYLGAVPKLGIVSRLFGGLFRSTDGRPFETLLFRVSVRGLSIEPGSPRTVYAAGDDGIRRTTDGGATWTAVLGGSSGTAVLTAPDGALYAGTFAGTFRSLDGGQSWERTNGTFAAARFAADPREPSVVFAAAPQTFQPEGFAGGLFRTADRGATFARVGAAEIGNDAAAVAIDPLATSTVYVASGARVLRSIDRGESWSDRSAGLPGRRVLSLAIDPVQPWILYAGTQGSGVFRSANGGGSWTSFNDGWLPGMSVSALAFDDTAGRRLYAGTDGGGAYAASTAGLAARCSPGTTSLCVADGRFSVSLRFDSPAGSGEARAIPLTLNSGAFWFFSANNVELVVKVVDGRAVNGHFWVFYGALTDVEFTLSVTDTETGAVRTFFNPAGRLASVADVAAF
jgi:hypothetical protein